MEKRGSKREFLILLVGQAALAVFSLGFLQVLLFALDARSYGALMFVYSTALWLGMLIYNPGIVPITKVAADSPDGHNLGGVLSDFLTATLLPVFLVCTVVCGVIFAVSGNIPTSDIVWMALFAALAATTTGIVTLLSSYAQGRRRRLLSVVLPNSMVALRIVLILVATLAGAATTNTVLGAIAGAGFGVAIAGILYIRSKQSWTPFRAAADLLRREGFFRQYIQNWPQLIGTSLFLYGDKVILGFFLPLEVLGLLALYQQIARLIATLTIGVTHQYLAPFFLADDVSPGRNIVASLLSAASFVPVALVSAAILPWANETLLNDVYQVSGAAFLLVCFTVAQLRTSQINELAFYRADRVSYLFWPLALSIVFFLVLGPLLASHFGLFGAVAGLIIATSIRHLCILWLIYRL